MNTARIRTATAAAAAIILAGLSVPAAAQTQNNIVTPGATGGGSSAAASNTRQSADQERVCMRVEMPASRVSRNVCKTRAEWQREGAFDRD